MLRRLAARDIRLAVDRPRRLGSTLAIPLRSGPTASPVFARRFVAHDSVERNVIHYSRFGFPDLHAFFALPFDNLYLFGRGALSAAGIRSGKVRNDNVRSLVTRSCRHESNWPREGRHLCDRNEGLIDLVVENSARYVSVRRKGPQIFLGEPDIVHVRYRAAVFLQMVLIHLNIAIRESGV